MQSRYPHAVMENEGASREIKERTYQEISVSDDGEFAGLDFLVSITPCKAGNPMEADGSTWNAALMGGLRAAVFTLSRVIIDRPVWFSRPLRHAGKDSRRGRERRTGAAPLAAKANPMRPIRDFLPFIFAKRRNARPAPRTPKRVYLAQDGHQTPGMGKSEGMAARLRSLRAEARRLGEVIAEGGR